MSTAQGTHGDGARSYSNGQAVQVLKALGEHGPRNPITVEELSRVTHIDGRTVRQIVSDFQCTTVFICSGNAGYYVAESRDQAMAAVRRLESQIRSEVARVQKMRAFVDRTWPEQQTGLDL